MTVRQKVTENFIGLSLSIKVLTFLKDYFSFCAIGGSSEPFIKQLHNATSSFMNSHLDLKLDINSDGFIIPSQF